MDGVLNEVTNTVHRHLTGAADPQTACGATKHLTHDSLRIISIDEAIDTIDAGKCGRCFEDGGGY